MKKNKLLLYFAFIFLSGNLFAQIDTVNFRFVPDPVTFKISCQAQKGTFGATDSIYEDFTLADTVGGAYTFDWGGSQEPIKDAAPFATFEFAAEGTYNITLSVVEDVTGTPFTRAKPFTIKDFIQVPNVFTPNDDGINDLFIVRANGQEPLEITIFTKTGTKVFTQKSPVIVWDGRNTSGTLVSQGLYYYILETYEDEPIKGFVYVIYDPSDLK